VKNNKIGDKRMIKRYTSMEYKNPDDLVFGKALYPVSGRFGVNIGAGFVVPEIKVAPKPGTEKDLETFVEHHKEITTEVLDICLQLGYKNIMIEQEHVFQQTLNPDYAYETALAQVEIAEKYHDEYGIGVLIEHTVADIRKEEEEGGIRESDRTHRMFDAFEQSSSAGVGSVAIETIGGKEISDYTIGRGDIKGTLFGIGVCGSEDMAWVWPQIVKIATKHGTIPAGDTDCSQANTAMFLAGGLMDREVSHTVAAVIRAIAAAKSLVAVEAGAIGPLKDCGYENPIVKAITGVPICIECTSICACAHIEVMGNLNRATGDVYSNEAVEYHQEFGGSTAEVWTAVTGNAADLSNTALQARQEKILRDLLTYSDMYRDPQGLVLAWPNAWRIGKVITEYGNDPYLRAKYAAIEAGNIILEAYDNKKLKLSRWELDTLNKAMETLNSLTDDADKFIEDCIKEYKNVPLFDPKNYGWTGA